MTAIVTLCIWILFAPVGYLACRWSNRRMGLKWTRNDRLFSIILSLCFGPMSAIVALVVVAIDKVAMSEWGNKEAGW